MLIFFMVILESSWDFYILMFQFETKNSVIKYFSLIIITQMQYPLNPFIIQQIQKQINRIKRITTAIAKKNPSLTDQFDDIIDATIQIEKVLQQENKKDGKTLDMRYSQYRNNEMFDYTMEFEFDLGDQYYNDAVTRIERCMEKFGKFQRKMNILINESTVGGLGKVGKSKSVKMFTQSDYKGYKLKELATKRNKEREIEIEIESQIKMTKEKYEPAQNKYKNRLKLENSQGNGVRHKIVKDSLKSSTQKLRLQEKPTKIQQNKKKIRKLDRQMQYIINQIQKQLSVGSEKHADTEGYQYEGEQDPEA